MDSLFVTCSHGLEALLIEELKQFSIHSARLGHRGVFIDHWDWNTLYTINYGSRLASRVLLPLVRFQCTDRRALYQAGRSIDWTLFLKERDRFAIDSNVHQHPLLRNSLFAAQVLKDAICDQIKEKTGSRPSISVEDPDLQLNLFIHGDRGVISLDTSGIPLHKRGYRQMSVQAPIQENLAAAFLMTAGFTGEQRFLDPCCGSGTLLIEAALIATHTPPGYLRQRWGFMYHPAFRQVEWLKVRNQLDEKRIPLAPGLIAGIDIEPEAVLATKTNLKAAGFLRLVEVKCADFNSFNPSSPPDLIITNPPHGKRLGEEQSLKPTYRALGDFMKRQSAKPGRGFVFTTSPFLAKEIGLAAGRRHIFFQSSVEGRLLEFELLKK